MPSAVERKELQQFPVVKEVSLQCSSWLPQLCIDNMVMMWVESWRGCKFYLKIGIPRWREQFGANVWQSCVDFDFVHLSI